MDDLTLIVIAAAVVVVVAVVVLFARPFQGIERRDNHSDGPVGD